MKTKLATLLLLAFAFTVHAGIDLQLAWDPVAPRPGEAISYKLYKQAVGTNWTLVASTPLTSNTITNVATGTHTFAVTAINQVGLESVKSAPVTTTVSDFQTTAPPAPGALRITVIVTPP